MGPAPSTDDIVDRFLSQRGHAVEEVAWDRSYNKKQCPECGGLHAEGAVECTVCGWQPA